VNCDQRESTGYLIVLALDISTSVEFPASNYIGTSIFGRLLLAALRTESLIIDDQLMAIGPLNDAIFSFQVSDRDRALSVLHRAIDPKALTRVARIGWLDEGELIWRQAWPLPEVGEPLHARLQRRYLAEMENPAHEQALGESLDPLAPPKRPD
jgi:hypothetical protein